MTPRHGARTLMIVDACVLIDFIKADRAVLKLIVEHVGPLHVASPVVDEVNEIEGENELFEIGLLIIEPEIEDAYAAASLSGATSFQDNICLFTAKRHGFTCVTNDKNLRELCRQKDIPILWGLELLAKLHKAGGISGKEAEMIARAIQACNSRHITARIVSQFMEIIRSQDNVRSRQCSGN